MRKFYYIFALLALVMTGCSNDDFLEPDVQRPVVPEGKALVTITGEGVKATTKSTASRVEFEGGYATGAGLYDGAADVVVEAIPYAGYRLVEFTGGPVNGNSSELSGNSRYAFNIKYTDWQFDVTFKKEYTVTVKAEAGGTVKGGGTVLDGENCTVTATPNSGYTFAGWYEGTNKVSSSASYTFTVSSNRTLTAKFAAGEPLFYVKFTDEQFDERGGVDAGSLYYVGGSEASVDNQTAGVLKYIVYPYDGYEPDLYINVNDGYDFLGWYSSTGELISTYTELTGQEIYYAQIPKGATIFAAFRRNGEINPNKKYTITILNNGAYGYVGFESNFQWGAATTKTVSDGEEVTIYAIGNEGNDDSDWGTEPWWYYVEGFYSSEGGQLYKKCGDIYNDINAEYTFTARANRTIYVNFIKHTGQ